MDNLNITTNVIPLIVPLYEYYHVVLNKYVSVAALNYVAVRIEVDYETQHSKIGRCSDCSIDESLPCGSDSLSRRYRMRLALHVILRLDQEDCILGRGLTVAVLDA
jgi:hypothetical protein